MVHFIKSLFKDMIDQAWTIVGLGVAWIVMEGSARDVVAAMIWITLGIWVLTFPLRYEKPEQD